MDTHALHLLKDTGTPEPTIDPMADLNWDHKPVLQPGADFHEDTLYMTFPAQRTVTRRVGKGKDAVEYKTQETQTLVVTSTGRIFWYDPLMLLDEGFLMPDAIVLQEKESRWPKDKLRQWLTDRVTPGYKPADPVNLYLRLADIYKTHVEYADDLFYSLMPLFIMGTYVFRLFPSFAYMHFNGTRATGKSQNLRLMRAFGFNTKWAANMSTASLFRITQGAPGLICIDEVESFDGERGEEIRRLLNAGYKKGEAAHRAEPNADKQMSVRAYDVYSPKAIASINPMEPVIQSRCIVVPMQPAIRRIPEFIDTDERWAPVRHELYRWAMDNAVALRDLYLLWNDGENALRFTEAPDLQNRQWEITQSFIILAHHIDPTLDKSRELIAYFNRYFADQQRAQDAADRQQLLLRVIPRVFETKEIQTFDGITYLRIKDIHEVVSEYLNEDEKEFYRTKATGRHLTTLGFPDRKSQKGGALVAITEDAVREQFRKRHVEPLPQDADWLAGTVSYVSRRTPQTTATIWENLADDDG